MELLRTHHVPDPESSWPSALYNKEMNREISFKAFCDGKCSVCCVAETLNQNP